VHASLHTPAATPKAAFWGRHTPQLAQMARAGKLGSNEGADGGQATKAAHLAEAGVLGVEGESALQHTAAALHMVYPIPQPDPFLQLRPGHPGLGEVRAQLHATLEGVPRADVVLQAAAALSQGSGLIESLVGLTSQKYSAACMCSPPLGLVESNNVAKFQYVIKRGPSTYSRCRAS
jgi:hypothetical protein